MIRNTFLCLFIFGLLASSSFAEDPTNVVFVITDDQGYGDLGCTGNPIIKTPNIDQLATESSGLSDYHVAPTCSPTRCAVLTGHWTNRTGAWHTIMGRSMLRENEVTVGQIFADAGYQTGMFGKWHLGDNYPYRPEDRGFTEVYRHGGGGVGQTPDLWDNAYFDGSYFHNGNIAPAKGFCTDVFFEQANAFIGKCAKEKKPFFAYISTNAPHGAGVSWYGPCDFEQTDLFNHDDRPNFRDRFGPRIAPRGTKGAKKLELYREMSPVNYLTKDSPPLLMIQGDKDTTIPVKHAYRMQKQAEKIGAAVETVIVKNAGHNWRGVDAAINPSRKSIIDRTVKFFVASQNPSHHEPSDEVSSVSRMPEFSWDTIPRYIHIRKAEKFTDEELQYLAGFSLITLEKTTGLKSYGSTDAGTIEAAKSIKQINPDAKVLFYRNVFVHYPGYSFDDQLDSIPGWCLKTKRGEDRVVRKQSRGYDTSNESLRKWWVDSAAQVCQSQHVDGLFLDGNIKSLSSYLKRQLPKGKKEETIEGYRNMMTDTRKALGPEKLMVANIIRARFPQSGLEYMNYFDGTYLECFTKPAGTKLNKQDYLAKGIEATQTVAREGKIVAMTLGLGESGVSDGVDETHKRIDDISAISQDQLQFKLALFLICAEKHSYLCLHDGYCVDTRGRKKICQSGLWLKSLPEYQKPLGPPKGSAVKKGYIYTREFEHASVWLDIENSQGKVTWK